ncbi:MAG: hypothetical protein MJE68_22895 [Proteobacteria bacterium]|nr:hypothetical protein [Pseudomonadota bacterium]
MLDMLPLFVALAIACIAFLGFLYTFLRALNAVQKEDIALLKADINGLKDDIAQVEIRLNASRREDAVRFEKGIADLNTKFDTAIAQINTKFDRYLFGKLEKTDDSDKGK